MSQIDKAGAVIRNILGGMADNPKVYRPGGMLTDRDQAFNGCLVYDVGRVAPNPPLGSELAEINPHALIAEYAYPGDLAEEAARRLTGVAQEPDKGEFIGLVARNQPEFRGARGQMLWWPAGKSKVIELAAKSDDPLRTLIHESRHATETNANLGRRAVSSISSAKYKSADEAQAITQPGRRYYAKPSELLTHLGEVGDDFVRQEKRLIRAPSDADAAIEMLAAGEAGQRFHPLVREFYSQVYRNSPTARKHMRDVMTKYYSVPAAAAVGSQLNDE